MKKSLTKQIVVLILCLLVGTILACFVINTTFLGKYYMHEKKNLLVESYEVLQNASQVGTLYSEEFDVAFENLCARQNLSIIVVRADGTAVRASMNDTAIIKKQLNDIIFSQETNQVEVLDTEANYVIEKIRDNFGENMEYLILWGTLDDGNLILMRTAMESIRESAAIANRFLLYVGVCALGAGALASVFVGRRITKPVLQLTEISRKMVELDFDAKYHMTGRKHWFGKKEMGAMPDLTAQNELDQLGGHMNQLSETLERTISELKTANNQLLEDIEKKEQIDEMRKEFLSNVSHELKTPLALIQGYAEGLSACINDDPESRDFYCEVIIDEANKMNKMVKNLLELNQLEFGNEQVTMERFDITELICGVVNNADILLKQKEITVEMDLPKEYVWADEFKVEEVLTNYLSNAINHAEGERRIRITYEKKETCLRVCVFNTGKQIPQEDIDNVWVKFYKVDKARTREYGGNGIGLSIVKAIMDSFHQECGVSNHPDGVEFWLELSL